MQIVRIESKVKGNTKKSKKCELKKIGVFLFE